MCAMRSRPRCAQIAQQYNAVELLAAYREGLQVACERAQPFRAAYPKTLQVAAELAARELERPG